VCPYHSQRRLCSCVYWSRGRFSRFLGGFYSQNKLEFIYLQVPRANWVNNLRGEIFRDVQSKVPPAVRPDPLTESLIPLWRLFESCWAIEPASRPDVENAMESHKQWHAAYTRDLARCRELCSLIESNGNRLCFRRCIMDG
jgi:hypothetical protein